jgi:hypothetical protein
VPITYHPSYIKPPPIFTPNTVAMNVKAREYGTQTKPYLWEIVGEAKWYKHSTFPNCVSGTLNKTE